MNFFLIDSDIDVPMVSGIFFGTEPVAEVALVACLERLTAQVICANSGLVAGIVSATAVTRIFVSRFSTTLVSVPTFTVVIHDILLFVWGVESIIAVLALIVKTHD